MPHSPSPWKIKRDSFGGSSHSFIHCNREGGDEKTVACLMQGSGELDTEFKAWARGDEWVANTQLILAAPKMYEILKEVQSHIESQWSLDSEVIAETRRIILDIESVLEKIDS